MKKINFTCICLAVSSMIHAQVPNFQWANTTAAVIGPTMNPSSTSIMSRDNATDGAGNVYSTGAFYETADFDPGPGVFSLTSVGRSAFVYKLDASGNFLWARAFAPTGGQAYSIDTDAGNNVYIAGIYNGPVDFDPGPGVFNLSGSGTFILKLDAAGNFIWARSFVASDIMIGRIAVDPLTADVYATGSFNGNAVDFDPGAGSFLLSSVNSKDIFILKLDSQGNFTWAKQVGSPSSKDVGGAIAIDPAGDLCLTGIFTGTVDFDPGPGTYTLAAQSWSTSAFVSKLSPAGNFMWARCFEGAGMIGGNDIDTDSTGNIYTAGSFYGFIDFDPGAGSAPINAFGASDMFICKMDPAGNYMWAKQLGGSYSEEVFNLVVDKEGGAYTTGFFETSADFDPGPGQVILTTQVPSVYDLFISKLDMDGNFDWARVIKTGNSFGYGIALDTANNVYISGAYGGTGDFNTDAPAVLSLTSNCDMSAFMVKLGKPAAVGPPVSMTENSSLHALNLFPNPASDLLYVSTESGNSGTMQIRLLNTLGQVVLQGASEGSHQPFTIDKLAKGVYLAELSRDNKILAVQKLIKE